MKMRNEQIEVKSNSRILSKDQINMINLIMRHGVGSDILSQVFGVSHTTILKYSTIRMRFFDKKQQRRKMVLNDHIPVNEVEYFLDCCDFSNGSIADEHHDRKTLKHSPLLIVLSTRNSIVHFKVLCGARENSQKVREFIDEVIRLKLIPQGSFVCMDRVYSTMKRSAIIPVVYGKTQQRPHNAEVERCFGNLAKVVYADMKFVLKLNREEFTKYIEGLCELYYRKNAAPITKILEELEQLKKIQPLIKTETQETETENQQVITVPIKKKKQTNQTQ